MDYFTAQSLSNYNLELSSESYKLKQPTVNYLSGFSVVLSCRDLTAHRHIEFYAEV